MRINFFWLYFLLSPPDDVLSKIADLSHKKNEKKSEIESNFLNTPSGGLNWITIWFNKVLTQWFNLGSSVSVIKKLLSISPFVAKVPFVALKLILSDPCKLTWLKLVFSEIPLCTYCLIYMCAFFWHFSGSLLTKKKILFKKTSFYLVKHDFRVLAPTSI